MLAIKIGMFMWRQCKRQLATSSQQLLRGHKQDSSPPSELCDKAALVTGGASGIGLQCCKALLRCGCRGVTIADKDNECGDAALQELSEEFGNDKAVFVNCDVTKSELIDWAFKTTINAFNRLDIVVNNAGVLNDKVWENEINTNVCGTMVGSLLGLQYMAAHCLGKGGYVINIGSTMGLTPFGGCPIYSMTQSAILGLTRALGTGSHYDRTKVKVMALAVGLTETPLMVNATRNAINNRFSSDFKKELECHHWQKPDAIGNALIAAIRDGETGAIWVIECGSKPYKLCIPCYQDMKTRAKESIMECETPGKRSKPYVSKEECNEEDAKKDAKKQAKMGAMKEVNKEAKKEIKKPPPKEVKKGPKPPVKKESKSDKDKADCKKKRSASAGSKSSAKSKKMSCPTAKWADGKPKKLKEREEQQKKAKVNATKKGVKMSPQDAKKIEKKPVKAPPAKPAKPAKSQSAKPLKPLPPPPPPPSKSAKPGKSVKGAKTTKSTKSPPGGAKKPAPAPVDKDKKPKKGLYGTCATFIPKKRPDEKSKSKFECECDEDDEKDDKRSRRSRSHRKRNKSGQ